MDNTVKEMGSTILEDGVHGFRVQMISIIGEIEGHECANNTTKTTKYEHLLPLLAQIEEQKDIQGVLFLINTVGGDVSCGLALAEMIAPSATVIIHPVRMGGQVIGAPQTYEYFQLIQDRITGFIADHSYMNQKQLEEMMVRPGILSRDLGTILVGRQAVECGLFQGVGGLKEAMDELLRQIQLLQLS